MVEQDRCALSRHVNVGCNSRRDLTDSSPIKAGDTSKANRQGLSRKQTRMPSNRMGKTNIENCAFCSLTLKHLTLSVLFLLVIHNSVAWSFRLERQRDETSLLDSAGRVPAEDTRQLRSQASSGLKIVGGDDYADVIVEQPRQRRRKSRRRELLHQYHLLHSTGWFFV